MSDIDKAREVIAGIPVLNRALASFPQIAAQALADANLLASEPHVVTTVEEFRALPPATPVRLYDGRVGRAGDRILYHQDWPLDHETLPATVLTPAPEPRVVTTDLNGAIENAALAHVAEFHEDAQSAPIPEAVDLLRRSSFALGAYWANDNLLASEPPRVATSVVTTVEELRTLDPDTVLDTTLGLNRARDVQAMHSDENVMRWLPATVLTPTRPPVTREQVDTIVHDVLGDMFTDALTDRIVSDIHDAILALVNGGAE